MVKKGKRIPIQAAKNVGSQYGYSQVIITAWDSDTGVTSVCTWGESLKDCDQAAQGGNFIKKALGWLEDKCKDKPARVIRRDKRPKKYKLGDVTFDSLEAKQIWVLKGIIHSLEYIGKETKISATEDKLRKLSIRQINGLIKSIK